MKILVAVKRVADANVKVRPKRDGSGADLQHVKCAINPFCEIAVEEAVRIKEAGNASEIIIVSIGSSACQEQIRTALALGGDRGIWIEAADDIEPLSVAKLLKYVADREEPQLILMGKQSIDGDNNQTAQMLAALTGMPQGTFASEVVIADGHVKVTREVDGGLQTVDLKLPAVISSDLRLNEPRYASLPNIMKVKRKQIEALKIEDTAVDVTPRQKVLSMALPPDRQAGIKVSSVEELVEKLRNEAKVI